MENMEDDFLRQRYSDELGEAEARVVRQLEWTTIFASDSIFWLRSEISSSFISQFQSLLLFFMIIYLSTNRRLISSIQSQRQIILYLHRCSQFLIRHHILKQTSILFIFRRSQSYKYFQYKLVGNIRIYNKKTLRRLRINRMNIQLELLLNHFMWRSLLILTKFSQLSEGEFIRIAYKQLHDLSIVAQKYEEEQIDINATDAILTIKGKGQTIVVNTQTPNRQLWYSSTLSGPQRFNLSNDLWVNGRNEQLSTTLQTDIKTLLKL